MAGTQISNAMNVNPVNAKTQAAGKADNSKSTSVAFSGLMQQYGAKNSGSQNISISCNDKGNDVQSGSTKVSYDSGNDRVPQMKNTSLKERIGQAGDQLSETSEKIVETVAEDFDMDIEDVKQAMELLGLTAMDLLQPQNLTALAKQLTGQTDSAELLVNTQFQSAWQDLGAIATEVTEQLGITKNDLAELSALMEPVDAGQTTESPDAAGGMEVPEEMIPGTDTVDTQTKGSVEEAVSGTDDMQNVKNPQNLQTEETVAEESVRTEQTQKGPQSEPVRTQNGIEKRVETDIRPQTEDSNPGGQQTDTGDESVSAPVTVQSTPQETVFEDALVQTDITQADQIDTLDIIRQIAEQTRVTVTQDISTMEMQLRPENLGRIYLEVTMKEGAVHAQLAAQDEAVKEALQAQIATLQEKLNQAGVRVDAIEVTVASHEFERNLEQNEHQDNENSDARQERSGGRRNLGVNSLDELSGLMSEEEQLAAQIMKDNGNSVDLTA